MRQRIRFLSTNSNALSIWMIVIGLVLAFWPGLVMTTVVTIVGIGLLVGGAISIYSWYRARFSGADYVMLAEGILLAIAGLFVLASPRLIISILPICVGLIILVNGIINLAQALDLKRWGYQNWALSLALAAITALAGLLIVFNPFSTMEMLVTAIGIIVVYNGLSNLWINTRYNRI